MPDTIKSDAELVREDLRYNFDAEHKPETFAALARLEAAALANREAHSYRVDFNGEAGETFQKVLQGFSGFTVEVRPHADEEREAFDAMFVGVDHDSSWYDAVLVKVTDEDGDPVPGAATESVRIDSLYIY